MRLPLNDHLHLREPGLHELREREAKLAELRLQDPSDEVVGFYDQHAVEVRDELLEEGIAVGEGDLGPRLNQVSAALHKEPLLLL